MQIPAIHHSANTGLSFASEFRFLKKAPYCHKDARTLSLENMSKPLMLIQTPNKHPQKSIFNIEFHYKGNSFNTKVLKVAFSYGYPIYKVVMSSAMNVGLVICWLQRSRDRWTIILGHNVISELKNTICDAIERQELHAIIIGKNKITL
jgi:hypothetical protein